MVDEENTLIKIAHYYYEDGLTQQDIAQKLSISRQKVNRSIKRLHEEGLVKIEIMKIKNSHAKTEIYLERLFDLKRVIIAHVDHEQSIINQIGKMGAAYITDHLESGMRIGVSWGKTLHEVGRNLTNGKKKDVEVVQLIGGVNSTNIADMTNEITRQFATAMDGIPHYMYAPAIVRNKALKDSILQDMSMQEVIGKINSCHMAIVGVGELGNDSTIYKQNYLDEEYRNFLLAKEAVGDICLQVFDETGNFIENDMEHSTIGISKEQLMKIPHVVAIAGGVEKVHAIVGAVRTRVVDVLVTDSITALLICKVLKAGGECNDSNVYFDD